MVRRRLCVVLAVCALLAVNGCSTLPKPSGEKEGILVIPIAVEQEIRRQFFGDYWLTVRDGRGNSYGSATLEAWKNMVVFRLPPGLYHLDSRFHYDQSASTGTTDRAGSSLVRPGEITINWFTAQIRMDRSKVHGYVMRLRWIRTSQDMYERIESLLSEDRNVHYWEIGER